MKKLFLGLGLVAATAASAQTLDERVEALEYKSYENFLKVKGQLEVRYDTLTNKTEQDDSQGAAFSKSESSEQYWRAFMQIDTESNPTSKLSVYTRLQATKFMNANGTATTSVFPDLVDGQDNSVSSQPFFTRFFANYKFTENDIFTFGRLPTFNGTPFNIKRGEATDGTYPIFAYNNIIDGMAYTRLIQTGESSQLALRAIYMPWTRIEGGNPVTANSANNNFNEDIEPTTNIVSVMAEYTDNKPSWARKFNTIVQYLGVDGNVSANFNDLTGTNTDSGKDTNFRQKVDRVVFTAEAYGIMESKFDLGLQYGTSTISANGLYQIPNGVGGTRGVGIFSDNGEEVTGSMVSGWFRFNMNPSNKFVVLFAQGEDFYVNNSLTRDLVDIYSNNGLGYQLVWNHMFDGGLNMSVGYINKQRDQNSVGLNVFGEPKDSDINDQALYTSFVANF
jgi:hypothetical protein